MSGKLDYKWVVYKNKSYNNNNSNDEDYDDYDNDEDSKWFKERKVRKLSED